MNSELAAMNRISRAVEAATEGLDPGERERVLGWFADWTLAQLDTARRTRSEGDPA